MKTASEIMDQEDLIFRSIDLDFNVGLLSHVIRLRSQYSKSYMNAEDDETKTAAMAGIDNCNDKIRKILCIPLNPSKQ